MTRMGESWTSRQRSRVRQEKFSIFKAAKLKGAFCNISSARVEIMSSALTTGNRICFRIEVIDHVGHPRYSMFESKKVFWQFEIEGATDETKELEMRVQEDVEQLTEDSKLVRRRIMSVRNSNLLPKLLLTQNIAD